MTTPNMQFNEPIQASTFNRFGFHVGTYIPELTASVTNPVLGDPDEREGQWMQLGQLMFVWGRFRFGSSTGTPTPSAGSGQYIVSLPTPATDLFISTFGALGIPIGTAMVRDNSVITNSRKAFVQIRSLGDFSTGEVATAMLGVYSGSFGEVSDSSPFTFAARDAIAFHAIYPTAFLANPG